MPTIFRRLERLRGHLRGLACALSIRVGSLNASVFCPAAFSAVYPQVARSLTRG